MTSKSPPTVVLDTVQVSDRLSVTWLLHSALLMIRSWSLSLIVIVWPSATAGAATSRARAARREAMRQDPATRRPRGQEDKSPGRQGLPARARGPTERPATFWQNELHSRG